MLAKFFLILKYLKITWKRKEFKIYIKFTIFDKQVILIILSY